MNPHTLITATQAAAIMYGTADNAAVKKIRRRWEWWLQSEGKRGLRYIKDGRERMTCQAWITDYLDGGSAPVQLPEPPTPQPAVVKRPQLDHRDLRGVF